MPDVYCAGCDQFQPPGRAAGMVDGLCAGCRDDAERADLRNALAESERAGVRKRVAPHQLRHDGTTTVATRDDAGVIWGPPVEVREEDGR